MLEGSKQPILSEWVKRKRKNRPDTRMGVYTDKGKQVLSTDACLHLQKIQQRKAQREAELEGLEGSDEELKLLSKKTRYIENKLEKLR